MDRRQELIWAMLRDLRAMPPGRADEPDRKKVFAASMQQFEELWKAAADSGVASKPLPLFYALSQAGRAISAASNPDNEFRLRGHGISWRKTNNGMDFLNAQLDVTKGAFSVIARLTSATPPVGPLVLGRLWYSLPDIAGLFAAGTQVSFPRALPAELRRKSGNGVFVMSDKFDAQVGWLPKQLLESSDQEGDLSRILMQYPTATGWEIPDGGLRVVALGEDTCMTLLTWTAQGSSEVDRRQAFERIATSTHRERWWIRPAVDQVNGQAVILSDLATWWALLYGFSIMARYEPDTWVNLLNVDESRHAVPLESVLAAGVRMVPKLVLETLTGEAVFPEDWD